MDIQAEGYQIQGLGKINIILGKNGAGKSTLLRNIQGAYQHADPKQLLTTSYITPERGGILSYEAGTEHNIRNNPRWMPQERKKNLTSNFRQQTVAQFRNLQTIISEEIESLVENDIKPSKDILFKRYVEKINTLLDQIEIRPDKKIFSMYKKGTENIIDASNISSGESELIALSIESLVFSKEDDFDRPKVLLLDEPDVHLHPDLQVRFMRFLHELATEENFTVILATHSTAILGALEKYSDVNIAFLVNGQNIINFESINKIYRKILPMFGAHPLSNIFNEAPVLLVEGEDDERIWQTAVRSSNGHIIIYPCSVDGTPEMPKFEKDIIKIMKAVYENAKGYSLRDKDESGYDELNDEGPLIRFRLKCREIENLLLTDEVIKETRIKTWESLRDKLVIWIKNNSEHCYIQTMKDFQNSNFDRRNFDIKNIRNILVNEMGETRTWEVLVGKTIGNSMWNDSTNFNTENSIFTFLGEKLSKSLLPKSI
ncbi:MAG: hypothetical protein UV60_C0008G0035 [Parcubacteria group bacterium GW2011_GWA2_43_11]|nr:MAG: hypothetical protein UU89_C0016G0006 [Parcubacteria group bacterium GW2011_GWC2_42_11]KKS85413.1 MAG: hypothetical protein UV60_C0008G0035 [Parcubacteria group bacterium GW2011_GWA2_43_11]